MKARDIVVQCGGKNFVPLHRNLVRVLINDRKNVLVLVLMKDALVLMKNAFVLMKNAFVLMKNAFVLMKSAFVLMKSAFVLM